MEMTKEAGKVQEPSLDLMFFYQRYQALVEQFESGDIRVTFGLMALAVGYLAKDLAAGVALTDAMYSNSNLIFLTVLCLWGAGYSTWNRHRVLHAVKNLVILERILGVSKEGISYWMGDRHRPWLYLLLSPWPWLLSLFVIGGFASPRPWIGWYLLLGHICLMVTFILIFRRPCFLATANDDDRNLTEKEKRWLPEEPADLS